MPQPELTTAQQLANYVSIGFWLLMGCFAAWLLITPDKKEK